MRIRMTSRLWRLASACAVAVVATAGAALAAASGDYNVVTGHDGLIMVDKVGGYIRFFDPVTLQEHADEAFNPSAVPGVKPHEIAISPDHRFAYVSLYGDGIYGSNPHPGHAIAVIDLKSHKMVGSIDVSPNVAPHGLQVDADGTLYVTCDLSRKVLVIDPAKREIKATIDVEGTGHWIALLPNGAKLYVANKTDRPFVSVVDLKQRRMVGRAPMPNGTQGIVAAPDGSKVLVADSGEPSLAVISPTTDQVVDHIAVSGEKSGIYKVFYSPDGKRVLLLKSSGQMNILDANDLHGPQKVLQVGRNAMGFAFAPDGKTAIVGNHSDGTASVIDLAAGTITRTFPAGAGVETLAYY